MTFEYEKMTQQPLNGDVIFYFYFIFNLGIFLLILIFIFFTSQF